MPVKQIFFYHPEFSSAETNDKLVLECGYCHFACTVKKQDNTIAAFELFMFAKEEAYDFESLVSELVSLSSVLRQHFSSVEVYINNPYAVLVPAYKFNKDISEDYLCIAFGEDRNMLKAFDSVDTDPVIMNVFRLPAQWHAALSRLYKIDRLKHTYSSIIAKSLTHVDDGAVIHVQFYPSHFILCVVVNGKLQMVQSFDYTTHEDVLYHLLNIAHLLELTSHSIVLRISGLIDLQSNLYTELVKYFDQVKVADILPGELGNELKYPAHYFTPFSQLAI